MDIAKINGRNSNEAEEIFSQCCGAKNWVNGMLKCMPFISHEELFQRADEIWNSLEEKDWREAFLHHPKIGDLNSLKAKYSGSKTLAEKEQSGVSGASNDTLSELAALNNEYEKKFGFIFIVCATGKSADEMLELIKIRIGNDPLTELKTAMKEQSKITKLRLEKII